jgi:PhnB protein
MKKITLVSKTEEHTMQLNPYLNFKGQCEAAFKFYEKSLGAKITFMQPHAGTPIESQVPPEWRNRILHATLQVGSGQLQGADAQPDHYKRPAGVCVTLQIERATEAERVFQALSENATVQMPLQETFWAVRFGMLTDQFGIPWMINCGKAA